MTKKHWWSRFDLRRKSSAPTKEVFVGSTDRPHWCPDRLACKALRRRRNYCSGQLGIVAKHVVDRPGEEKFEGVNTHRLCLRDAGMDPNHPLIIDVNREDIDVMRWMFDGFDGRKTSIANAKGFYSQQEVDDIKIPLDRSLP